MGLGLGMIQKLNFERSLLDLSYFPRANDEIFKSDQPVGIGSDAVLPL
jgi:hypothetical protein